MLFNSLEFTIFLPLVFLFYWAIKKRELQNILLVTASYLFYGWWDWRFLFLIIFSSFVDYFIGISLGKEEKPQRRKWLLWISLGVNLGMLLVFKYYNFFIDSFIDAFGMAGLNIQASMLNVILPVGISFYTFQTLSYTIDVYKKKIQPTHDIVAFFAFVSFFPQLVAGPIERASALLPQFLKARKFEYHKAVDGAQQILWGLFKKIVIADNCAGIVNEIFNSSAELSGSALLIGGILFAFQIYGDFSGYSDIAIGTARFFGFDLMKNFAFPYFSRDIAEFWRRWHISLSTWFRDYLYIPLGGSRGSKGKQIRNIFIIFIVSGFWHGANWTFIAWGALNAAFFLPLMLTGNNRNNLDIVAKGKVLPSLRELGSIGITFLLTVIAWVFFRAETIGHALEYLSGIFSKSLFKIPEVKPEPIVIASLAIFLMVEWLQRDKEHALDLSKSKIPVWGKFGIYYAIILFIFCFGGSSQDFIYFQF